jgi:UDP-N-acetylglucosamine 2-epimerase (non-hydrolysing)
VNFASPLTVASVFGTRPEAIKLAPLIGRLMRDPDKYKAVTIVTAQHREMLDQVLDLFSIQPDYDLDILRPRQSLAQIAASAITGLDSILADLKPDIIVVQGDTSTTFLGALAAFYHKIPVAHVEAGLRTGKKYYPFPEEINRQLTSVISDAHFAPTPASMRNLIREGIPQGKIWVTGNTVIDALQDVLSWDRRFVNPILDRVERDELRMILVTSHRRENQGKPQERICSALLEIVERYKDVLIVFPVHLSPAVRDVILPRLRQNDRIILLEPLDYFETIHFMKASYLMLTDSGGIQEEAPALGKPVLVLRDETERPEGIDAGTVRLVGTETENIVGIVAELLSNREVYKKMAESVNPYGDGHACDRILQVLQFLGGRAPRPGNIGYAPSKDRITSESSLG